MRWRRLFDDLEAHVREQELAERRTEVADRTRRERAGVRVLDRLLAHEGELDLMLTTGRSVGGRLEDVGDGWCTVVGSGAQHLVPLRAVVQIAGLAPRVDTGESTRTVRRLSLGYALRALSRNRSAIRLDDVLGRTVTGTIDNVGGDFVEVTEHPLDVPRRPENILGRRLLPTSAIVCVSATS